jgi:serpin B
MDGTRELFIAYVIHKAFIATDEAGAEAAAATAVLMAAGVAPMREDPAVVHADHPFLIVIREISTVAPPFLGRVADPTQR